MFGETDNWYSNGEPIAKEILQDDAAAARKLINSTSLWERIVG